MARKKSYAVLEREVLRLNNYLHASELRCTVAIEDAQRADLAQEQLRQEFNRTISATKRDLSTETARADMWSSSHKEITVSLDRAKQQVAHKDAEITVLRDAIVKLAKRLP